MNLLMIVESPVKAKIITGYLADLDDKWTVMATLGHVVNLPQNTHGVEKNGNKFNGKWVLERGKGKIIEAIAKQGATADKIYVVTDPDREGEKIAADIIARAKLKNCVRMGVNEITKTKILAAIKQDWGAVNKQINEAQKARRLIDREVGYPVSQLIRADFRRNGVNATPHGVGRVISPALRIICEAEERIDGFTPEEYSNIFVEYFIDGEQFFATCKTKFRNTEHELLQESLGIVQRSQHIVANYKRVNKDHSPPPPLITSQLQHSAFYLFGYHPDQTMKLAQQLFECGYITYIRSDSYRISEEVVEEIVQAVDKHMGSEYTHNVGRKYTDPPRAQAGHEAIRPTSFAEECFPENIMELWRTRGEEINRKGDKFTEDHMKLYRFIFYRTFATQMKDSIYDNTSTVIQANELKFEAQANVCLFSGWEKLGKEHIVGVEIEDWKERERILPQLDIGSWISPMNIDTMEKHTKRPDRYGVGRFVTTLDHAGIARPSTVAGVIPSLKKKGYIKILNGMLYPTETGQLVNNWTFENCEWLGDYVDAKDFEDQLDEIESGGNKTADELILEYHERVEHLKKALGLETYDKLPPTKDQIAYAKNLAEKNGVELPADTLADKKKLSAFISKYKPESIGKCPACKKGEISERDAFYGCSKFKGDCKFKLWKSGVERLLNQFHVPHDDNGLAIIKAASTTRPLKFDNLTGKAGPFSASIIFKKDKKYGWQLGLKYVK